MVFYQGFEPNNKLVFILTKAFGNDSAAQKRIERLAEGAKKVIIVVHPYTIKMTGINLRSDINLQTVVGQRDSSRQLVLYGIVQPNPVAHCVKYVCFGAMR